MSTENTESRPDASAQRSGAGDPPAATTPRAADDLELDARSDTATDARSTDGNGGFATFRSRVSRLLDRAIPVEVHNPRFGLKVAVWLSVMLVLYGLLRELRLPLPWHQAPVSMDVSASAIALRLGAPWHLGSGTLRAAGGEIDVMHADITLNVGSERTVGPGRTLHVQPVGCGLEMAEPTPRSDEAPFVCERGSAILSELDIGAGTVVTVRSKGFSGWQIEARESSEVRGRGALNGPLKVRLLDEKGGTLFDEVIDSGAGVGLLFQRDPVQVRSTTIGLARSPSLEQSLNGPFVTDIVLTDTDADQRVVGAIVSGSVEVRGVDTDVRRMARGDSLSFSHLEGRMISISAERNKNTLQAVFEGRAGSIEIVRMDSDAEPVSLTPVTIDLFLGSYYFQMLASLLGILFVLKSTRISGDAENGTDR